MKRFSKYYLIALVLTLLGSIHTVIAQVNFQASAPARVSVGEQFRYTLLVNASGTGLKLPNLEGFQLVMGPSTSSSTSVQYINGQMTRTQSTTYTYILVAQREGSFSLEPAQINVDGQVILSNSLTIEVTPGNTQQTQPQQQIPQSSIPETTTDKDIFIRTIVSKDNVYQGEPIIVTFKFYTKLDVTNLENPKPPALNGFFQQEIEIPPLRSLEREIVNGEVYGTGILRKVILFPQRSGELVIDPYELEVIVRERVAAPGRGFFDDFFGSTQLARKKAASPGVKIRVKPLPEPRPQGFAGAVGNFTLKASTDKTEAKANEPVNFTLRISGTGNLKLIDQPKVDYPIGFEVYDSRIRENINNTESGASGSKTFETLIIPRHQGSFRIPSVSFIYFDPSTGIYKTLRSEEINLQIEKGDESESGTTITGFAREDIRLIGQDIRFIKLNAPMYKRLDRAFFGSPGFILAYLIPVFVLAFVVIIRRKQIQFNSDIKRVRNRRAARIAKRRLKKADLLLKQGKNQEFYEEVLQSAWGYLGDKLNIPLAELSRASVNEKVLNYEAIQPEIDNLLSVIDICEAARYSPGYPGSETGRIYSEISLLIQEIENKMQIK